MLTTVYRAAVALILLALSAFLGNALRAQERTTMVGLVGGRAMTEQLWSRAAETERISGLLIGAWVDAATPAGWFSIRAEGALTQRGGNVFGEVAGQTVTGGIRSDYLAIAVHARAAKGFGRTRFHVAAGPVLDKLLRSRIDSNLAQVLNQEVATVFGVGAGVGFGVRVAREVIVEAEARVFEGLGDAYGGDFLAVRYRSSEFVVRVGVPLRR